MSKRFPFLVFCKNTRAARGYVRMDYVIGWKPAKASAQQKKTGRTIYGKTLAMLFFLHLADTIEVPRTARNKCRKAKNHFSKVLFGVYMAHFVICMCVWPRVLSSITVATSSWKMEIFQNINTVFGSIRSGSLLYFLDNSCWQRPTHLEFTSQNIWWCANTYEPYVT